MTPNVSRPAGAPLSRALARPRDARRGRGDRPRHRGHGEEREQPERRQRRAQSGEGPVETCGDAARDRLSEHSSRSGSGRRCRIRVEARSRARPSVNRPDARAGYSSFPTVARARFGAGQTAATRPREERTSCRRGRPQPRPKRASVCRVVLRSRRGCFLPREWIARLGVAGDRPLSRPTAVETMKRPIGAASPLPHLVGRMRSCPCTARPA